MSTAKKTRQGVRDLSYIKAPSKGKKMDPIPAMAQCDHRVVRKIHGGGSVCNCGASWDKQGNRIE